MLPAGWADWQLRLGETASKNHTSYRCLSATLTLEAPGKLPRYQGGRLILRRSVLVEEVTCAGWGAGAQTDATAAARPAPRSWEAAAARRLGSCGELTCLACQNPMGVGSSLPFPTVPTQVQPEFVLPGQWKPKGCSTPLVQRRCYPARRRCRSHSRQHLALLRAPVLRTTLPS